MDKYNMAEAGIVSITGNVTQGVHEEITIRFNHFPQDDEALADREYLAFTLPNITDAAKFVAELKERLDAGISYFQVPLPA